MGRIDRPGVGECVVIEEIDQIAARGPQSDIALHGGLPSARHQYLETIGRIIQRFGRSDRRNVGLPGPCGDDDGDDGQFAHHGFTAEGRFCFATP